MVLAHAIVTCPGLALDLIQCDSVHARSAHGRPTYHFRQSSGRHDVSCVHETVEMAGALLNLLPHVVVDFHVKDVCYQIQRILVVLHFGVESSQVESIGQVVFVDFAIVFVAT